jgi:hypothetical protein
MPQGQDETTLEQAQLLARMRLRELHPELFRGTDNPEVTLAEIAELHDVAYATTLQWKQRGRPDYAGKGALAPFPEESESSRPHNPRYRLSEVVRWSWEMAKWPAPIGRPTTRRRDRSRV